MSRKRVDLTGRRFGKLTAIEYVGSSEIGSLWSCRCDCGEAANKRAHHLLNGTSTSCGCDFKKTGPKPGLRSYGFESEYNIWALMKQRCYNQKRIVVCDRWRSNFEAFLGDMGARPSSRHTLERLENDGNYEPANCKWATWKEQASNRRNSKRIPEPEYYI